MVRTEGISDMEVAVARWTLMLIPDKIAWNLSMIFLPDIPLFVEILINFSFPIFWIWFCYLFLALGDRDKRVVPSLDSCFALRLVLSSKNKPCCPQCYFFLHFWNHRDLALYRCIVMFIKW